ncbi:MAG: DUF4959 domain-containing protein [Niabella sp.]
MQKIFQIMILFTIVLWYGCKKAEIRDYTDPNTPAPAQISNVTAIPTAGGALITYTIPSDPNIAYVKAVYEIQPGVTRETKASIYNDTLSIAGYGDTNEHEVKLYSVGKNEKASEPLSIKIRPGEAPVNTVFNTLSMVSTFGGVNIQFTNELQSNLAIVVMVDSSGQGTWAPVTTFYTAAKSGSFSVRGFPSEAKKFSVYLRDRWNNRSSTLEKILTPLAEQLLDKSKFREHTLPTDMEPVSGAFPVSKIWDNKLVYDAYITARTAPMPSHFTFDLGVTASLSRLKLFSTREHAYIDGGVKSFEIWGTATTPNPNGSFDGWTLLGSFEAFKPSGLPLGQATEEDYNYATFLGDDINFPDGVPPVRYLRFKTLSNYGGDGLIVLSELTFWGQVN